MESLDSHMPAGNKGGCSSQPTVEEGHQDLAPGGVDISNLKLELGVTGEDKNTIGATGDSINKEIPILSNYLNIKKDILKKKSVPLIKKKILKKSGEKESGFKSPSSLASKNGLVPGEYPVQKPRKFLNKKRKKNEFIDDEAEEEEKEYEENEFEEDGPYESSFINDNEENLDNISFYNNIDNENINLKENYIELNKEKFLNYFDVKNINKFNTQLKKDLNFYLINFLEKKNLKEKINLKNEEIYFGYKLNYWYQFITFCESLFKIEFRIHYDLWPDMSKGDVDFEIAETFKNLIIKSISRDGIVLNFLNFYILNILPQEDLLNLYYNLDRFFNFRFDPVNIKFKILKNPGQTIKIYEEVNLINYKECEEANLDFYKDKEKNYDENLNNEKLEKNKQLIKNNIEKNRYFDIAREQLEYINTGFYYNDKFDNDFDVIEEKEKLFKNNYKLDCYSFGFVIYMDKENYKNDPQLDQNIHFPHLLPVMCKAVVFYLKKFIPNKKIKKIIIAHEHGETNKKCHCQGFLEFKDRINLKLNPGSFKIKLIQKPGLDYDENKPPQNYLIMFQSSKNRKALENYVKKKDELVPLNKYIEYENIKYNCNDCFLKYDFLKGEDNENSGLDLSKLNKNESNEEFKELLNMILTLPNLDVENLKELALNSDVVKIKEFIITNFQKLIDTNKKINDIKIVPEFKWTFPQYALDYINNYKSDIPGFKDNELFCVYNEIYKWFLKYCINNDPNKFDSKNSNRKKGILIYGDRGIGKTTFFQNFCGEFANVIDNPFIIYCRNTISWSDFENKLDTAQLIILDDITFIQKQKELIKGLIVGQSVTIRSLYIDNKVFNKSLPCVILTNNFQTYLYMCNSSEFNCDLIKFGIDFYIGPLNTKPEREDYTFNSWGVRELIKDYEEKNERRQKNKNDINNYIDNLFKH